MMSDDLSGRTLGRYQVLERLGRGGMAEVYRAYQPSLDRYVAIKVIYPHLASDPALLERFGREARAVAALHHPNIVQVHDFDVQSGSAFMAMEFISGPTLKAAIQSLHRRGMLLPLPVVGQIVGQIADALGYAHEQRVVHRDVKPANVLIRRRGSADAPLGDAELDALLLGVGPTSVVLTDFGVARIIKDSVEHTAAGTILGSPAYMSPEQGRGERADARSDIYSLGIVLYELLTGQVPFDADTPFAIVIKHSTAALPPPRSLRPDLPAPVEQVLLKALAKDPAGRFTDAAAFGAALREATGALAATSSLSLAPAPAPAAQGVSRETRVIEMTEMRPTPTPEPAAAVRPAPAIKERTKKPPRPRSCLRTTLIALGALAAIAVITVGAFVAGGALVFRGLGQAGALVVPTEMSVQATQAAAEGAAFPVGPRPPRSPTATADPGDPVAVALSGGRAACAGPGCPGGSASGALEIYNRALAETPDSAELLAARAQLYVWWDVYTYADQARADVAAALSIDDDTAVAYLARGGIAWATADGDAARAAIMDDFDRAIELDPDLTDAYLERARFLFSAPDFYDEIAPSRDQAITDAGEVIARAPDNAAALRLRAAAYEAASRFDEAMADTNAALAIDPGDVESLLQRAALNRYHYGQPDAAIADFTTVITIDGNSRDARAGRGALLIASGNYEVALDDAHALIAIDPADASGYIFRGFVLLAMDRAPEAQRDFEDALTLGPDEIGARYGRGLALLAQDQAEEAIPDLEAAVQGQDDLYDIYEVFSDNRPSAGVSLARAYMAAGRMGDAGPALDAAVEASPDWYLPYLVRARYRRAAGDLAGARVDLRSAAASAASAAERAEVEREQARQP
ncbi:protein kinase [Oscillochloris sp. ZM17-4]|uniref:serine/threonine-protein kinase n=1 Tax=Oscillochloris sp. ZM17-4 TaxID=2866714 RepID=UPI001C736E51|nr:serine/threonine-protein kinase [Oscillochloris sp. ZM17-4]MBX0327703.1 protein kinase [Oscillochloris sp. ZM17-4]